MLRVHLVTAGFLGAAVVVASAVAASGLGDEPPRAWGAARGGRGGAGPRHPHSVRGARAPALQPLLTAARRADGIPARAAAAEIVLLRDGTGDSRRCLCLAAPVQPPSPDHLLRDATLPGPSGPWYCGP